ncbi:2TM domain-containing protein [Lutibacter sp.]|uniref:2TM domain-containing protein n=1 Tax=Lutibacter sp. TaxID=1925666 RepID=UPI0025BFEB88|nr:2TM domain-containing protein [Lutibacter sp.]MCF6181644.1 2TM domain-containing protein [Lutibacter sp.]
MRTSYTEEDKYIRAKKKVDNLKGFYSNLLAYVLVIPFLIFINYKTSPGYYWFWWPMFGWGIGICFHAFNVFNYKIGLGKDWEERKIKEFMNNDNNHKF